MMRGNFSDPVWTEPEMVELVGGPCDGERIPFPGGMFALVQDFRTGKVAEYVYEEHRNGVQMTVKTATFVRMRP